MKKYRTVWRALLLLLVMSLGGLVLVQVYRRAWVSEDAFITLRYVSNALGGHGVVFNPGERVQGYSHPLWLLMLLVGCATGVDHIYVVVVSGMGLTLLLIFVLFAHGVRLSPNPWRGILAGLGVLAVWACSESWLSFQTGGLENPLAHLLIAMFTISVLTKGYSRPFFISFLSALIALTRPDLALLTAPVCLAVVCRFRQWRQMMSFTAGLLPLITWVILAWLYYGTPVPNPAYAKLGIYPTAKAAVGQGLRYVDDWFRYDPGGGWGFALFLLVALFEEGRSRVIPPVIGIGLYLLWVICIGGDFMRGRLFTPILTMTGVLAANRLAVRGRGLRGLLAGSRIVYAVGLAGVLAGTALVEDDGQISSAGIVNERKYYPGYGLHYYRRFGRLENPHISLEIAGLLRRYAEQCGAVTVHFRSPGTLGYLAGPKVHVIDTLGLTDRYIARLPRRLLREKHPRPGHPDKYIPISYLAKKGDIAILPGWLDAVEDLDCSFRDRPRAFVDSRNLLDPWTRIE